VNLRWLKRARPPGLSQTFTIIGTISAGQNLICNIVNTGFW